MKTNGWGWRFAWALGAILPLMVTGRPGVSLAADVHAIHAKGAGARPCSDCHTGSKHNSSLQIGGSGTLEVPLGGGEKFFHINGSVDADGAYVDNATNPYCTNIDCHFGPAGTGTTNDVQNTDVALKCGSCHPAAADADDFTYGNGTMAKINTTQWNESGHGASSNYASGNTGANLAGPAYDPEGCGYCHDFSVQHGDAGNPFRLANNNVLTHGWIDACLVCHSTGDAGYDPDGSGSGYVVRGHTAANQGKATDSNHYGGSHVNAGDGGEFCWDCHDPHGDRGSSTGNFYMLQSAVSRATDGTYGIPSATQTVTFTRKTIGSIATPGYYVESTNTPATGVCQACHTPTDGFPGEVKYWRNNQTEDVNSDGTDENTAVASRHNSAAVCTDCHQHKNEFAAGCTDCHGNNTSGARWPDSLANNPNRSSYADDAGAHDKHVTAIFNQNTLPGGNDTEKKNNTCGWCHPGNPPPGHPSDAATGANRAEVTRMDLNDDNTPEFWTHTNGTTGTLVYYKTISNTDDIDAYIKFTGGAPVCFNANCHGGSASPAWYGTSDTTPPTVATVHVNGSASYSFQQGSATQVTLTADASDAAAANVIVAGEYFLGSRGAAGTGTPMSATDGVFDEKTNEALTATVSTSAWTAGSYTLYVNAKDAANNWGPATGGSVSVTVTALDSFTMAHTNGSTESVNTGATNVVMQRLAFTASGPVDLLTLKVLGTTSAGDVAADVAAVKIYNDIGGSTPGTWEAGDTQIGSGFLNSTSKDVTIDIADQAIPNGTTGYLYILFDISGSATGGDVLGAQLTALTFGPTDSLSGGLPPATGPIKTIVAAGGDTAPPTVGTLQVWFGGSPVTTIQEETATVTLTAVANDTITGGNNISAAEYFIGGTSWTPTNGTPMLAVDGAFNGQTENLTSNTGMVPPQVNTTSWTAAGGPYTIYVDARDAAGNWSNAGAASITITVTPKILVDPTGTGL